MKIPDRLRAVLIEGMLVQALRAPFNAQQAPSLPDGWELCWCADCSASVVTDENDGFRMYALLADVAVFMHEDECPWSWLATQ